MKKNQRDVSVCIVSFNTKEHLEKCLTSIYELTKNIAFEVIVVDNGSNDGSAEMVQKEFPKVLLIKNSGNKWFSGANNQALRQAQSTYVFFLNPDTWITTNVIKNLKDWMDQHPRVGACEPRQVDAQGQSAPTGSRLPRWWIDLVELTELSRLLGSVGRVGVVRKPGAIREFRQEQRDRAKNWQTEVVSGAAMFTRGDAVRKAGGFNERLKLYYTDTDLCRKFLLDGWKVWHVGECSLYHSLSVATSQLSWVERSSIYAEDARTYFGIVGKPIQGWILSVVMMLNSRIVALWK